MVKQTLSVIWAFYWDISIDRKGQIGQIQHLTKMRNWHQQMMPLWNLVFYLNMTSWFGIFLTQIAYIQRS